jgi:mannose-6-phosphate isomerase
MSSVATATAATAAATATATANATATAAATANATAIKTVFCDIDGTLLEHTGSIQSNCTGSPRLLPGAVDAIREWDRNNYRIVLTTGRKESTRRETEAYLTEMGIHYDHLIMGLPNGDRVLINDKKPHGVRNTAYAINLVRNQGVEHVSLGGKHVTLADRFVPESGRFEKPWGYEELVDVNDKYVVKKLFMKAGHSCSTQYHMLKRETILVFSGRLRISIGPSLEEMASREYGPGETVTIEPYTVHKMEGIEDAVYYETSTNELWDVVRLADAYGRASQAIPQAMPQAMQQAPLPAMVINTKSYEEIMSILCSGTHS